MKKLVIYKAFGADENLVSNAEKKLDTKVIENIDEASEDALLLQIAPDGISLRRGNLVMQGDFSKLLSRITPGKLKSEMLLKAAKLKNIDGIPHVLDATAGMGEDSFILAAAGARVELFEKDPIIALLLTDAINRAKSDVKCAHIAERMTVHETDSISYMKNTKEEFDIVYLDPMFPDRNKSALIKKKFQLIGQIEAPATDGVSLLSAAIDLKPMRIIVKRPLKGEILGDVKPHYSLKGKAIRYDCFTFAR